MCKHHDRCAAGKSTHIVFQPCELILAQNPQPALGDIHHVDEANEVDTALVEAEPAAALGAFAVARAEFLAIVTDHIVFAGHIKNLTSLCGFEKLIQRVEFRWLGKMRQVPGVQNEIRRCGQGVDLAMASLSVPTTSVLAGLLKPMWLSLI